jgi:endonuclease/exonuclease/phosphatase family metal-dependent hydrolase
MSRPVKTILLVAIIAGGLWALINRDRLKEPSELIAAMRAKLRAASGSLQPNLIPQRQTTSELTEWTTEPVIRVASFKLNQFGSRKEDLKWLPLLADICRRYDVIALQGFDGRNDRWLEALADGLQSLNSQADYAFVTDSIQPTQNAILFNRQTIELDESKWYLVSDPDGALQRRPLVCWFRTRVLTADAAFTFSLVNVEFNFPGMELARLVDLFRAVRNDGRGEDDVILAGDFNCSDQELMLAGKKSGLTWVISDLATNVRQTAQFENIVFQRQATLEFSGRGGVLDFMRLHNLRLSDAEALSTRLPVWAEFSAFEDLEGPSQPRTSQAK